MKRYIFALIMVFALSLPLSIARAEEEKAALGKVDVSIEVKDGVYLVTEHINLLHPNSAPDGKLEHTISKINQIQTENVKFTTGNQELATEEQEGDSLKKIFVQLPSASSDALEYTIAYQANIPDGKHTIPLIVPMYATEKTGNVVTISFQAPEGMVVQQNSFPIVIEKNQNRVESHMINLPSHVSYLFGEEASMFTSHNLISVVTVLILFLILIVWAKVERNNTRRRA